MTSIQVYEGDGTVAFIDRFGKAAKLTEILFDVLEKERVNLGMHTYLIPCLRRAMVTGDKPTILTDIRHLREKLQGMFTDQSCDVRVAAMIADEEWKAALDYLW